MNRVEFAKACSATFAALQAGPSRLAAGGWPNILFAIADDQSWGHTSIEGCAYVRTPAFDRVAREGVRFTHAFSPARHALPLVAPS